MSEIKLIVTDLDNTLLRRDKTVSDRTVEVLRHCRESGIKLAFATARPKRAVFQYLDILKRIEFDAMAFHNGAVIFCGGAPAVNYGIAPDVAQTIALKLAQCGLSVGLEIDDVNYSNYDAAEGWPGMEFVYTDFGDLPDMPADKIIIKAPTAETAASVREILPENLYFEISEGVLGLIMNREAKKLRAAEVFAGHFGIVLRNIAAFGDDLNDAELLRNSGIGVAVENALDEVKAIADYICGDCDSDGVAVWLGENC
jgi:Cof subfamily protein (haloacid dehalogenase superfamily)